MQTLIQIRNASVCAIVLAGLALFTNPARAQVPGDDCSNAFTAVPGVNVPVFTGIMTPSPNPPADEGCTALNWNNSKDAWWRFNAPMAGTLTLEFCSSTFDTSTVVYQGTCGELTRIGCDDDSCNPEGPGYQSRITNLKVSAGPVFIRVGGYAGVIGQVDLTLAFAPAIGAVRAWGNDVYGQCDTPVDLADAAQIAGGTFHTIALRANGAVRCWGYNEFGQCNTPADLTDATQVAGGYRHTIALRANGSVRCWGNNDQGQISTPADLIDAVQVAGGSNHTIALRANRAVRCWGANEYGQCNTPADLTNATQVAGGGFHSIALLANGTIRGWGLNDFGQNSLGGIGFVQVAAGEYHTVALYQDGTVRCQGLNNAGQCDVPADLSGVVQIAAGERHTLALRADGTIACWGSNAHGQCALPPVRGVDQIASGGLHSIIFSTEDCDQNAVLDLHELDGRDCNGNLYLDSCDATDNLLEDCNANGLGDTCEKQLSINAYSMFFSPIGRGSPAVWVVPGAVRAVTPVTLRVQARGDFDAYLEYVRVRIGTVLDVNVLGTSGACIVSPAWHDIVIDPESFNQCIDATGALRITVDPSDAVDALGCAGATWLRMNLVYVGAWSSDCNINGVLDSCEIAGGWVPDTNGNGVIDSCESLLVPCDPDFDGSGVVNGADLGVLLGAWGPVSAGAAVDLNSDGVVNGADLGTLLGAWGPCAE